MQTHPSCLCSSMPLRFEHPMPFYQLMMVMMMTHTRHQISNHMTHYHKKFARLFLTTFMWMNRFSRSLAWRMKNTEYDKTVLSPVHHNRTKKKNFQFDASLGNIFNYNVHSSTCFVLNKRCWCCCCCCFCCCHHLAWDKTTQFIYPFFHQNLFLFSFFLSWMTMLTLTKCGRTFGAAGLMIEHFVQHVTWTSF